MKSKKAATPETILILAIMTVLLWSSTLFILAFKNTKNQNNLADVRLVEGVYAQEELARFYYTHGYTPSQIQTLIPDLVIQGTSVQIFFNLGREKDNIQAFYSFELPG